MDATYTDNFFEKLNTSLSLTYNNTGLRYAVPTGDSFGLTNDLLLELTGDYVFNENLDLLVGGTSYFLTGNTQPGDDQNRGVPNYFDTWLSGYSQINYRPFPFLKLVGGGQVNKATNLNIDFVPRLAIIANVTPEFGAKVLYDQAFRAPYEAETSMSDPPVLTGNKNLLPEKITSFDAQLFYNTEFYQLSSTYFYNIQKQLITRTTPTDIAQKDFQVTYTNKGELSGQGVEFEGKIVPIRNLFLIGSFTFQNNILNNEIKNATLIPNVMGKLGVSYASDLGFSVGIFNTYMGMVGNVANVNPNVKNLNPEVTPFNNLTAKVSVNINKLLNLGLNEDILLSVYGVNLLNNKIYYPEFVRKNINTLPGKPGISIYSDLSFGF